MKDDKGNRLINETELMLGVASLAGEMGKAFESVLPVAQELAQTIANAFDYQGYDVVNGSSGSSSSSGSSIKGLSEQAGDIIAGYINSIRADTSVNRITLAQILVAVQQQSEMPTIARSQLEQLRLIASYTKTIAENTAKIGEIHGILNTNILGGNYFRIK